MEFLLSCDPTSGSSFSDFKIVCAGKEYNVHRIILASHSGYFKRLFQSNFKEVDEQKVELKEDPEAAVAAMMRYFYSFEYSAARILLSYKKGERPGFLEGHSWMFTIADKYDVPGLKDLAFSEFVGLAKYYQHWKDWHYMAYGLMKAVPHIYQNTPPTDQRLRDFVVKCFSEKEDLLGACRKDTFDAVMQEVPEFAGDLVRAMGRVKMIEAESVVQTSASGEET